MIKHGVALMRLAYARDGYVAGKGNIEEFYVVVSEGDILPTRYTTYADAFKHSEKLLKGRVDVA